MYLSDVGGIIDKKSLNRFNNDKEEKTTVFGQQECIYPLRQRKGAHVQNDMI